MSPLSRTAPRTVATPTPRHTLEDVLEAFHHQADRQGAKETPVAPDSRVLQSWRRFLEGQPK